MFGLMMDEPLLISSVARHAARIHGSVEIAYLEHDGSLGRCTYAEAHARSKRIAKALLRRGVRQGDRIATLAWNNHRHFELYYGIPGVGAIIHTLNPRLFRDQLRYIVGHAADRILFFDPAFIGLVEDLADDLTSVEAFVVLGPRSAVPASRLKLECYEDWIEAEDDDFEWPSFDERTASGLCYTSGTTGNPRGALYSHRSTILHTLAACATDGHGVSGGDCILPVVPMFHANAWGIPYSAAASGAKLVLPGSQVDGATLCRHFVREQVTLSLGVPTVWTSVLDHCDAEGLVLETLRRVIIGGSAVPQSMIDRFRTPHGVEVLQAWGMTEMSPFGSSTAPKHRHRMAGRDAVDGVNRTQGRPPYLVETKICDAAGAEQPHDGIARGDLYVRGPWVISGYYENAEATAEAFRMNGWLKTGDVCTIDAEGYIRIVDRSKDVIKSGGEWISSIELENIAVGHPAVAEAAVIAVPHPKWEERPLLVVVPRAGQRVDKADLLKFFEGRVAKWWLPDDVVVLDEIPHTATGKISKLSLRDRLGGYRLPGV